jgi:hypothetical protein
MIREREKTIGIDKIAQTICVLYPLGCRNKKNSITAQYLGRILSE